MKPKNFPGWRMLKRDERLRLSDVFVMVNKPSCAKELKALTPETGDKIPPHIVGGNASIWIDGDPLHWMIYRRSGDPSIPRRTVMNKSFSEPLPLP